MQFNRFPGTTGGNAHFLVVVSGRAAGGESVVEPKAVFAGDAVCDVGKAGGAFIGGDDQIWIIIVTAQDIFRRNYKVAFAVVGKVEQATNEGFVALYAFFHEFFAAVGWLFDNEAALGTHWHNDGVFNHLRFHESQDFGAEIFMTV